MAEVPILAQWEEFERERYDIVIEGIRNSDTPDASTGFHEFADRINRIHRLKGLVESGQWSLMSADEKRCVNESLYDAINEPAYSESIGNPDVSARAYGPIYGPVIAAVYEELLQVIPHVTAGIYKPFLYVSELISEIFGHIEKDGIDRGIKQSLYYFAHDYFSEYAELGLYEAKCETATDSLSDIILRAASEESALYDYGFAVTEETRRIYRYLASLPQEQIDRMAETFVNGYLDGFETMRIDRTGKCYVEMRTCIGFERVTAKAMEMFRQAGMVPLTFRTMREMAYKSLGCVRGIYALSANRQHDYDHRNDCLLYLNRQYLDVFYQGLKAALDTVRESCTKFAGPAVQEIFGESEIVYRNKKTVPVAKGRTISYLNEKRTKASVIIQKYIKQDEISFTIIAYPIPEIGPGFETIFDETVACNCLSNSRYKRIQQALIDVLDRGQYVTVTGRGKNKTNMKVMLHTLTDPAKQTNFENCGADVNIPVGEVFTSPVLKGTEGILHVSKVYLEGNEFKNLKISFKDGMIQNCTCDNFKTKEENDTYIRENILFQHETLPIGEFAIGTNTVAYAMGIRHGIQEKLPILIAEKTGPHFAVGDTCYSHSEDHAVYNPDGKEIIARDNEVSALRKDNPEKAYLNCHTDITVPYDELDEIAVHTADGEVITVIKDGRFTVPGAEELNGPLNGLEK